MKILFVGNCNHYFNRKLAEELKTLDKSIVIDIFSTVKLDNSFSMPFNKIFDNKSSRKKIPFFLKITGFFTLYYYIKWNANLVKIIRHSSYDYVHIQGLELWHYGIEKYFDNIILTIWGSDFLRSSKLRLNLMKNLIKRTKKITFASNDLSKLFNDFFNSMHKHEIVRFGLNVFDKIDKVRNIDLKKDIEQLTVTIGYNRHSAQQHLKILDELFKIESIFRKKIKLVIPLTYGPIDNEYLNLIKEKVNILGYNSEFYYEFLSEYEIAKLCIQSDIMIQLQTTDAFSGSMQEYMYAGNIVITGKWLKYNSLIEKGVYFHEIEHFSQLSEILKSVIFNISKEKLKAVNNSKKLYEISSWSVNIKKWYKLYS